MKSDSGLHPIGAIPSRATPAASAKEAFFDSLLQPAALCALDLTVLVSNAAFAERAATGHPAGRALAELFPGAELAVPSEGGVLEVRAADRGGNPVLLTLSRRGDTLALLVRDAARSVAEPTRKERALLELSREVASATSEDQLVAVVAAGVKGLFPGHPFCIRIVDARSGALTSLYAEGELRDGPRDQLVLRRSALEKTRLKASSLPPGRVQVTDGEVSRLFVGSVLALSAPLAASGQLFGAINLEYLQGQGSDHEADERLLIQLANQVAVGVRNAKLIDELTFVRKRLEELLESANALILVANKDRSVQVFNQVFARLTGLAKEDVLGRDLLEVFPETEAPRMLGVLGDTFRGERVTFETQVRAPLGREVRVALATSCVLDAQGDVEGVIAIGQDLTGLRELERRIVQAEKLSSLGKLAASVAHEINNPMTAIAAYAESVLERVRNGPNDDQTDKLRKIVDNSRRILRFAHDLVSYARPAPDRPQEVQLHPTLDLAVSFCDHELQQSGVTVEREYGDVPPLLGVPGHLVQVFVNLITNACHATASGGTVRLVTRVEDGRVLIRVEDSGRGIAPEHLKQVFEPFFTTKPEGRGTGLGLSIVQGIVEKHGGRIDVASQIGRGTVFDIRLPLRGS